jgi:hypothetical protein
MKYVAAFVLALALCTSAVADTLSAYAYETGTIQPNGPRTGDNGNRYFNIEGADYGDYASYGALRWDTSDIIAGFDATYGAGNWQIDEVTVAFTQEPAFWVTDGPMDIFFASNDTINIKTGNDVVYGDMGAPLGVDVDNDTPVASYNFVGGAQGQVDYHTFSDVATIEADMMNDTTLTLMVYEGASSTAAGYRGQEEYEGRMPPQLIITATPEPASLALLALGGLALIRRR